MPVLAQMRESALVRVRAVLQEHTRLVTWMIALTQEPQQMVWTKSRDGEWMQAIPLEGPVFELNQKQTLEQGLLLQEGINQEKKLKNEHERLLQMFMEIDRAWNWMDAQNRSEWIWMLAKGYIILTLSTLLYLKVRHDPLWSVGRLKNLHVLSKSIKEELFGNLDEAQYHWRQEGLSQWSVNVRVLERRILLLFAGVRCKINDIVFTKWWESRRGV
jgi:hypothetical protein